MDIIAKLEEAKLRGRGGAEFPTWRKWQMVKEAPGRKKFVVCNVSEGEPAVFKDHFILETQPELVVDGIDLAMDAVGAATGYLYLRKDYYSMFKDRMIGIIGNRPIELFREPCGYLGGEETTLLETIEGNRCEPRIKPPYPTQVGLFGCPTLVNNLETLFYAARIARGEYHSERLYCISGDVPCRGVFEYPAEWTIRQVLQESRNDPPDEFFVQAGGGGSGTILLQTELDQPLSGAGAIIVHDRKKTDLQQLMYEWTRFFIQENCGKCLPCREGVYRLNEMLERSSFDVQIASEIITALKETSFCPFGKGVANAFEGLVTKLWNQTQ